MRAEQSSHRSFRHFFNCRSRVQRSDTAACNDAFLHSCFGGSQRILNAEFLLFHLDLSRCTDLDNRDTARQFCQALLQLLFVVIAGRGFDLCADLVDPIFDLLAVA